jgi:hypothetical protein
MSAELHVTTTGSDPAEGSADRPLRTISRAAAIARPGDTVLVHGGEYREWVQPQRGGLSDRRRITYTAAAEKWVTAPPATTVTRPRSRTIWPSWPIRPKATTNASLRSCSRSPSATTSTSSEPGPLTPRTGRPSSATATPPPRSSTKAPRSSWSAAFRPPTTTSEWRPSAERSRTGPLRRRRLRGGRRCTGRPGHRPGRGGQDPIGLLPSRTYQRPHVRRLAQPRVVIRRADSAVIGRIDISVKPDTFAG